MKLVLTRADDMRFDSFRSPSMQTLRMAFGDGGKVTAMEHHAVAPAGRPRSMAPSLHAQGRQRRPLRPFAITAPTIGTTWARNGCARSRTTSPTAPFGRAGCARSGPAGPTGRWRASWTRRRDGGADPLAFRLGLLDAAGRNAGLGAERRGRRKRQAAVLKRAAEKAGWGAAMPKDTGLGIATTFGQERDMPTWVACVARVRVDRRTGAVMVEKLTLVVDAGTVVHPDGALAQVEGAACGA